VAEKNAMGLSEIVAALAEATGHVDELRARRDDLVRAELAAGTSYANLSAITGLGYQTLYAIRNGKRSRRQPRT
jgi:hypothetical protein